MFIPNAMSIESAIETLKTRDPRWLADQQKELHEAVGDKSDDFKAGYELGIETGRVMVATSGEVVTHGADPEKIL
jgi:diaminopimelate decarboxylase